MLVCPKTGLCLAQSRVLSRLDEGGGGGGECPIRVVRVGGQQKRNLPSKAAVGCCKIDKQRMHTWNRATWRKIKKTGGSSGLTGEKHAPELAGAPSVRSAGQQRRALGFVLAPCTGLSMELPCLAAAPRMHGSPEACLDSLVLQYGPSHQFLTQSSLAAGTMLNWQKLTAAVDCTEASLAHPSLQAVLILRG